MARPAGSICKDFAYFSRDCDLILDDKINDLAAICGWYAPFIYEEMLAMIYSGEGYFMEYSDRTPFRVARRLGTDSELAKEVIYECIKLGLFDDEQITKNSVLTSRAIQERYLAMMTARMRSKSSAEGYCKQCAYWYDTINDYLPTENQLPVDDKQLPVDKKQQSKVKESKVKESKEDTLSGTPDIAPLVIDYLNQKTNHSYHVTDSHRRKISARVNEGFTIDDFRRVIDGKVAEWSGNVKLEKFLRPETLFGTKFDTYLAQCKDAPQNDWGDYDD